ncbi:MAG: FAD-binding oxidoreductase [Gammaproteobacteria bacterium]|nr:FAD-binding oxidoreductase [Gammaproteobacteria bacterium]
MISELKKEFEGEFYDDVMMRRLYSTDASVYEELPRAVAIPKTLNDLKRLVYFANAKNIPLLPRAAGTSIAGQCVGDGIVVDITKYFRKISVLSHANEIKVEAGVVLDDLNDYLKPYGLRFAPDISTSNRCTIGGMIGNNAAGAHSLVYGTTRNHIKDITAILTDGSIVTFGNLSEQEFSEKLILETKEGDIYRTVSRVLGNNLKEIKSAYPSEKIIRQNTGYALDHLARQKPWNLDGEEFSLAPLICGSEGTLAFVVEATLKLIPIPSHRALVCSHFDKLNDSMVATVEILKTNPVAIELIDRRILELAALNGAQKENRFWIRGQPRAVLVTEFFSDSVLELEKLMSEFVQSMCDKDIGYAHVIIGEENIPKVWSIRKAGLGLLMGLKSPRKPVAVIEDSAVFPECLPEFVEDIESILAAHSVECVYYGHASVGLLHFRPELDLDDPKDQKKFREIAEEFVIRVKHYKGSLSGEHGDGRLRSPFIKYMLGESVYQLLEEIKNVFDPKNIFNPGKIISKQSFDKPLRARFNNKAWKPQTGFNWSQSLGLVPEINNCNGAAACRKRSGRGAMCPSFHASNDELFVTRGRANLLRHVFRSEENFHELILNSTLDKSLSHCLACKACKAECPSNVDMAKLKSEWLYQKQKMTGFQARSVLIRFFPSYLKFGRRFPGVFNYIQQSRFFLKILGLSSKRKLPLLSRHKFSNTVLNHSVYSKQAKVVLICDIFTRSYDPKIIEAAIVFFKFLNLNVDIYQLKNSPRLLISNGLLDEARISLRRVVHDLQKHSEQENTYFVGLEPSELLVLKDEIFDLIRDSRSISILKKLEKRVFLFEEFLAYYLEENPDMVSVLRQQVDFKSGVHLHVHCHQKALSKVSIVSSVFDSFLSGKVTVLNNGCCGMSGQFGYEYPEFSRKVAKSELSSLLNIEDNGDIVIANGISCRSQISFFSNRAAHHSAVFLAKHMGLLAVN